MMFSKRSTQQIGSTKLNKITIKEVSNCAYQGSKLTWDNDSMKDIKRWQQERTVSLRYYGKTNKDAVCVAADRGPMRNIGIGTLILAGTGTHQ